MASFRVTNPAGARGNTPETQQYEVDAVAERPTLSCAPEVDEDPFEAADKADRKKRGKKRKKEKARPLSPEQDSAALKGQLVIHVCYYSGSWESCYYSACEKSVALVW